MKSKQNNFFTHFILIFASAVSIFPVLWILSASFKFKKDIFSETIQLIPHNFTLSNYEYIFTGDNGIFLKWIFNTISISLLTTLLSVFLASTAAFAFSQFKFKGRRLGLYLFIITQMFPGAILVVPLYSIFKNLGLFNSYTGLIIAYATTAVPFCVWMLKSYMDTIPKDIVEAARIDGLNEFGIFYKIIVPLSMPGIVVTSFFAFITAWNEFMFAMTFITKKELYTIPVGLKTFLSQFDTSWHYLSAGAVVITIPALIIFLFAQKKLVDGLTLGGVKG